MSSHMKLPSGSDISKDDLIVNVSYVMIHNHTSTVKEILALVEEGGKCKEVV